MPTPQPQRVQAPKPIDEPEDEAAPGELDELEAALVLLNRSLLGLIHATRETTPAPAQR